MVVSNYSRKMKLKYDYIRDLILVEEVHRRDSGKISSSSFALNVDTQGRRHDRSKPMIRGMSKSRFGQQICWNCGKISNIKRNCSNLKRRRMTL